jgi:hypothetical protein
MFGISHGARFSDCTGRPQRRFVDFGTLWVDHYRAQDIQPVAAVTHNQNFARAGCIPGQRANVDLMGDNKWPILAIREQRKSICGLAVAGREILKKRIEDRCLFDRTELQQLSRVPATAPLARQDDIERVAPLLKCRANAGCLIPALLA